MIDISRLIVWVMIFAVAAAITLAILVMIKLARDKEARLPFTKQPLRAPGESARRKADEIFDSVVLPHVIFLPVASSRILLREGSREGAKLPPLWRRSIKIGGKRGAGRKGGVSPLLSPRLWIDREQPAKRTRRLQLRRRGGEWLLAASLGRAAGAS